MTLDRVIQWPVTMGSGAISLPVGLVLLTCQQPAMSTRKPSPFSLEPSSCCLVATHSELIATVALLAIVLFLVLATKRPDGYLDEDVHLGHRCDQVVCTA